MSVLDELVTAVQKTRHDEAVRDLPHLQHYQLAITLAGFVSP